MNQLLLGSRINGQPIDFGALACGYTPVDLDTFAMDNGGTQKELVGRTYAPDGHLKLLHSWPPKLPQAGRIDYGAATGLKAIREAASLSL